VGNNRACLEKQNNRGKGGLNISCFITVHEGVGGTHTLPPTGMDPRGKGKGEEEEGRCISKNWCLGENGQWGGESKKIPH